MNRIDPRALILPPFQPCPYCGEYGFGVVAIEDDRYRRRCRSCLRPSRSDRRVSCLLPPVTKKILYLDQFAFTDATYIAQPELAPAKTARLLTERPTWASALRRVIELVSAQVLVCPLSTFHVDETLPFTHRDEVHRTMLALSTGVQLADDFLLELAQLSEAFDAWLARKGIEVSADMPVVPFEPSPHRWSPRYTVGVSLESIYGGLAEEIRRRRQHRADKLRDLVKEWSTDGRTMAKHVDDELGDYGETVLSTLVEYEQALRSRLDRLLAGDAAVTRLAPPTPPLSFERWTSLQDRLPQQVTDRSERRDLVVAFLRDRDALRTVPILALRAMLYASLARKSAGGQTNVNDGTVTDIEMFANAAPYTDAIVVDRAFGELVRSSPAKQWLDDRQVRVLPAGEGLSDWLDQVVAVATGEHRDVVAEVYGNETALTISVSPELGPPADPRKPV